MSKGEEMSIKTEIKIEDLEQYDELTIDGEQYLFICEFSDCLVLFWLNDMEKNIARIFPVEYLNKCTLCYREDTEKIIYEVGDIYNLFT